jgi:hypothetical protein
VSAGCRVIVLLFRRYIRDDRLRGFSATERMAVVRPSGGFDGHFDVRVVHCISIRHFEQNLLRLDEDQPKLIHEALH